MNIRSMIAAVLLLFVVVSLVVLAVKEVSRGGADAAAGDGRLATADSAAPGSPEGPGVAAPVPGVDYDPAGPERQVTVYYFCTSIRCPSCHKIENWTREAVTANFQDELGSGLLRWSMVNTDLAGNEHYIDDYGLYTKQVILVERAKGMQVRWRNLDRVWELLGNREEFASYVKAEVSRFVAGERNDTTSGDAV